MIAGGAQAGAPAERTQLGGAPAGGAQADGAQADDRARAAYPGDARTGDTVAGGAEASDDWAGDTAASGDRTARPRARGTVAFVGAGPGAADLLTLRAARIIAEADVVIWASSLVHPGVLAHVRPGTVVVDSAALPLEGVLPYYEQAARERLAVARVHSGDPGLFGAIQEQLDACARLDMDVEIVPGVSAYSAAAAAVQRELTYPEVAQSVVLTRLEGGRTPMPAGETIRAFARHGTTMAIFLSAARSVRLQAELLAGGYPPDTPVVVAHRVSWPDELLLRCWLGDLAATVRQHRLWKHTLFLVGPALAAGGARSRLYHPGFSTGHRAADVEARQALRAAEREGREQ